MVKTGRDVVLLFKARGFANLVNIYQLLPKQAPVFVVAIRIANQRVQHQITGQLPQHGAMFIGLGEHGSDGLDDIFDGMAGLLKTHFRVIAFQITCHNLIPMHQLLRW